MGALEILKDRAKQLLTAGEVKMVIGYGRGSTADRRRAIFISDEAQADKLVLDKSCEDNLAGYLVREGLLQDGKKVAIFLSPAGIRSVNVLAAEDQLNPDQVVILGFEIKGDQVSALDGHHVNGFIELVGQIKKQGLSKDREELIAKLEKMTPPERFEFWRAQFSKCLKCYACRQGCPMCYCRRCIVDRNQPQWINTSPHSMGNFEWNIVRAFHLAGRCVGCGNCERACPVGIPLMLLNQQMAAEVLSAFDHFAGMNSTQEPVLASFKREDPDTFIL
ncbi:MAG: 4Fe-4S dicluster domain-containing protein [Phycisphaerae bacterium]